MTCRFLCYMLGVVAMSSWGSSFATVASLRTMRGSSPLFPLGNVNVFPLAPQNGLSAREAGRRLLSMALPRRMASVAWLAAGMVLGCCFSPGLYSSMKLYRTVPDIPSAMFKNHEWIRGTVISVSDGDSIRVRHRPRIPLRSTKMTGRVTEETLQIRLYAVDCPEVAHFGNPAQPWGEEAKEFTSKALNGRTVGIKLLRKDQYQRAVCMVRYGCWPFRKDISAELLRGGLGVLYRQGGAEYDGKKEELSALEVRAKDGKSGLWQNSKGETPAQFKARMRRRQGASA